jgi:SPP1 gp7 family putative phage head morphogenesis protein
MSKDANLNLYDHYVDHFADARRYEEKLKVSIGRTVSRHQKRLRDTYLKNPSNPDFTPELRRFSVELNSLIKEGVSEYGDTAISFFSNEIDSAVGKFFNVKRPKVGSAYPNTIGPSFSKTTIENNIANIVQYSNLRLNSIIKRAANDPAATKKDTLQKLLNSTKMSDSQARSLTRTAITNAQHNANLAVINENKELFKGVRYTAILDSRTTSLCASRDGTVFPVDNIKYALPAHWNCRSSYVPVLLSKQDLLGLPSERIKKTALESVNNLSGETPQVEGFSEWLRRQPMDIKLKYLGSEEKVGLFEQGALNLTNFITNAGNSISIEVLRKLDNARTAFFRTRQTEIKPTVNLVDIKRPYDLTRSIAARNALREFYLNDASDLSQPLSLVDYRGTSLVGKRVSRTRSNNEFDERNNSFDPFTGETRSTLLYDPDFNVYQERLDFVNASKTLTKDQKQWIIEFVEGLEDTISVNQQSAITENLRIVFERYNQGKIPWENFSAVLRSEMNFSVVNTSRILDRRSRAASQQFEGFGVAGEPAKVQILGKYYTFDDIIDKTLENQRYIQSWPAQFATPISRKVYYSGRSPLYTYFQGPIGRDTLEKQFKAKLEKAIRDIPGGRLWLDRNKPTESMMVEFIRTKREQFRRIIDLEFLFNKNKMNYLDELLIDNIGGKEGIRVLNKVTTLIASGESTDYDTLAINIGKLLRQEWKLTEKHVFPFWKPTLQDYHADGSKILTAFRDQGLIRVISRGKTRRSVIDLDTGRASGPWKDTVSREVQILNRNMLELQAANRATLLSRRIGVVNTRDKLYVRPGQKNYFDARGRDTGIPIITRRANANYDTDLIDRDFANMLNHTMSVEYEVDPTFASFMEDVVRFRDPRGNVAKYDDLNTFRRLILTRGDQGYSLIQTIKYHRENGKPFSVIANIDGRGRVYYQGFLTPTGGSVARPFLNSAKSYAMNSESLRELTVQLGVLVADLTEGLSQTGRVAAFVRNEKGFRELGEILLSTTQRDRRIREFLEHPLVRSMDAEDLPQLVRLALEYTRIYNHVDGDLTNTAKLATYRTKLMVDNDASASGAQMIALAARDKQLALNSNVIPTAQKNRLYDLVAMDTVSDPEFQKIRALNDAGITWEDLQKAAKSANMVQLYGIHVPYQNSVNSVKLLNRGQYRAKLNRV